MKLVPKRGCMLLVDPPSKGSLLVAIPQAGVYCCSMRLGLTERRFYCLPPTRYFCMRLTTSKFLPLSNPKDGLKLLSDALFYCYFVAS